MSETYPKANDANAPAEGDEVLRPLAEAVEEAFGDISDSISGELARLSAESRQSVRDMVDDILEDLARLAVQRAVGGVLGSGEDVRQGMAAEALETIFKRSIRNG